MLTLPEMMKIKCCNNSLRKIFVSNCSLNTYEKKKKKRLSSSA